MINANKASSSHSSQAIGNHPSDSGKPEATLAFEKQLARVAQHQLTPSDESDDEVFMRDNPVRLRPTAVGQRQTQREANLKIESTSPPVPAKRHSILPTVRDIQSAGAPRGGVGAKPVPAKRLSLPTQPARVKFVDRQATGWNKKMLSANEFALEKQLSFPWKANLTRTPLPKREIINKLIACKNLRDFEETIKSFYWDKAIPDEIVDALNGILNNFGRDKTYMAYCYFWEYIKSVDKLRDIIENSFALEFYCNSQYREHFYHVVKETLEGKNCKAIASKYQITDQIELDLMHYYSLSGGAIKLDVEVSQNCKDVANSHGVISEDILCSMQHYKVTCMANEIGNYSERRFIRHGDPDAWAVEIGLDQPKPLKRFKELYYAEKLRHKMRGCKTYTDALIYLHGETKISPRQKAKLLNDFIDIGHCFTWENASQEYDFLRHPTHSPRVGQRLVAKKLPDAYLT